MNEGPHRHLVDPDINIQGSVNQYYLQLYHTLYVGY